MQRSHHAGNHMSHRQGMETQASSAASLRLHRMQQRVRVCFDKAVMADVLLPLSLYLVRYYMCRALLHGNESGQALLRSTLPHN